jgi:hypothetical protein
VSEEEVFIVLLREVQDKIILFMKKNSLHFTWKYEKEAICRLQEGI